MQVPTHILIQNVNRQQNRKTLETDKEEEEEGADEEGDEAKIKHH